ncbi:hypothetical protein [Glycomyces sp. NPDC021274]|uniref:hypothetical protein n=1 Tax=Glycomyces sp. NPDC021274 TaxID=3155120 RepID=UPI00340A5ADF
MTDQPALSDLDLDAWIDGTTGMTTVARIAQRGDLLDDRQRLEDELRLAKRVRAEDRGIDYRGPEQIQSELDNINRQFYESMLVVTMQDRTADHRRKIRDEATKELGLDAKADPGRYHMTLTLVEIADSIIKVETADGREIPMGAEGFGWQRLEKIRERCGESSLMELADRYREMTSSAPAVQAPLSRSSSST